MHAGRIKTSKRLQATLRAIRYYWRSTKDISRITGSMAVRSDVAALRAQGINVRSLYCGMSETGSRIWKYRVQN
ncbi:MAG: hypothetical protein WC373_04620 [Smithella sp.]